MGHTLRKKIKSKVIHNKNKKSKRSHRITLKHGGGKTHAFCLIIKNPSEIWLDFLNGFTDIYDVYIVIDDNTHDITEYSLRYPGIKLLQFNNKECRDAGFWDLNYLMKKDVTAWEKALYYFCIKNTSYENVWFCEEDVFFDNKDILANIDKKYIKSDLLYNNIGNNTSGELTSWEHWHRGKDLLRLPWLAGMVCLCRMSRRLLEKIKAFAKKNKKLEFLEILFPTLASHNNMLIEEPEELSKIKFSPISKSNINGSNKAYHAVKNIKQHAEYRSKK